MSCLYKIMVYRNVQNWDYDKYTYKNNGKQWAKQKILHKQAFAIQMHVCCLFKWKNTPGYGKLTWFSIMASCALFYYNTIHIQMFAKMIIT